MDCFQSVRAVKLQCRAVVFATVNVRLCNEAVHFVVAAFYAVQHRKAELLIGKVFVTAVLILVLVGIVRAAAQYAHVCNHCHCVCFGVARQSEVGKFVRHGEVAFGAVRLADVVAERVSVVVRAEHHVENIVAFGKGKYVLLK